MQRINCFGFYLLFDDNNEGLMTGSLCGIYFITGSDEAGM